MIPQLMAENVSRMSRTPSDSHELSRINRTMSVLELNSPDPASGCAACANRATAETKHVQTALRD